MSARSSSPPSTRHKVSRKSSGSQPAVARTSFLSTENSPYYQIWVLTNLAGRPFSSLFGERFDLNLTEWRILLTLADKPELTAQGLSEYTGLDKMSVSRILRKLESQGRLLRENSETDRRSYLLSLTKEGWAVYAEIARAAIEREGDIYAGLSAQELKTLHRLLGKLAAQARIDPVIDSA